MYRYDAIDQKLVDERVAQYRDQLARHLAGRLSEDDFRPLRLQNGLYIQRHAPMLRIAIPYGLLSSNQLRMLARIAREHDRGIGHFTTTSDTHVMRRPHCSGRRRPCLAPCVRPRRPARRSHTTA